MCKRVEAEVVKRAGKARPLYLVKVREYVSFLGFRLWEGNWKDTGKRFVSRVEAAKLALNIKDYLKGKYKP